MPLRTPSTTLLRAGRGRLLLTVLIAAAGGLLAWVLTHRASTAPFTMAPGMLTGWSLVASDGPGPWIVGVRPPEALTSAVLHEAERRAGRALVPPPQAALPLVLRSEFEEGLQGVYGSDSVMRIAREAGIERARFEPVCLAHHDLTGASEGSRVYFVAFESPVFDQMRLALVPPQPEQAGIGIYEPATLSPVLPVAATDAAAFDRMWPLAFDPARDCDATLVPPRLVQN